MASSAPAQSQSGAPPSAAVTTESGLPAPNSVAEGSTVPQQTPRSAKPNESKQGPPAWLVARNKAVEDARAGHYDDALPVLRDTYKQHGDDISVVRDYAAVLSWAGHDQEAVDIYQTMPAGDQPQFVLLAIGHSYRVLNRPSDALPVYDQGLQMLPDNLDFAIGEVRSLLDTNQDAKALTFADENLQKYGRRQDILLAADEAAVKIARKKDFKQPLDVLSRLHKEYPDEVGVTRDYIAVLAWSGRDADAVAVYKTLPAGDQPDYVLEAVGHSFRNLHRSAEAVPVYHELLNHQPDNLDFAIGYGRSLSESGQSEKSLAFCESDLKKHGRRKEVLDTAVDAATQLARHQKYKQSLSALHRLHQKYGDDYALKLNYMVILSWAGRDQECVDVYKTMPRKGSLPNYALLAVGHSLRDLHRPEEASVVYEQGLRQDPRSADLATGYIRTLTEAGFVEKALNVADENMAKYGKRFPILLAAGDAADQFGETTKAREYYAQANAISPRNKDALHGLIRTQDRTGSPESAMKLADANPGIVSASEYRHLQADNAAIMVRFATEQPEGEDGRFDATDRAIARLDALIAAWQNVPDAQADVQHARLDRIVAYHNRFKMQDVVLEYNDLVGEGVEIPNYVLSSVGDAYLYLHQPERARDIFLQVLQTDPNNYDTRKQLFYAYIECDDYDAAFQTIDKLAADEPDYLPNSQQSNPRKVSAEMIAGNGRLYAGMVRDADDRISPLVAAGPDSPANHEELGNLYSAHGWPRKALEQYESGVVLRGGKDVDNEIGVAATNLRLQNFAQSEAQASDLMQRYPMNTQVARLSRDEQIHNMAEIRIAAGYDFRPMTTHNVTGGEGYGVDTVIYSPPVGYNWRIFAGEYFTHQNEPNNEGSIGFSRSMLGAEYRNGPFTVSAAPTFNDYHSSQRVGFFGEGSYALNDMWTFAGRGELFARDTPLRALNQGTTASEGNLHAVYQPDEAHSLRFGGNVMPFSDGNFRSGADASYSQRLFTTPHLAFNGLVDLGESQNSENDNRSYYNPKMDFIGLIGGRATQILWERYNDVWQHSLTIEPGMYWQRYHGDSAALRMRYEQRVFLNQVFEAGLGVNFSRQAYDGTPENDVGLTLDVTGHF